MRPGKKGSERERRGKGDPIMLLWGPRTTTKGKKQVTEVTFQSFSSFYYLMGTVIYNHIRSRYSTTKYVTNSIKIQCIIMTNEKLYLLTWKLSSL